MKEFPKGQVMLYKNRVEVRLEKETVWLNLNQMADLFERDKSVISRHLHNVFKEKELSRFSTVAFFATVQKEGDRTVARQVEYFNLDAIISMGYRVNSRRGTEFRIWATQVLRKHLVEGYTLNERRLKAAEHKYRELQNSLKLLGNVIRLEPVSDETKGLIQVIMEYSRALDILDDFDHERLETPRGTKTSAAHLLYFVTKNHSFVDGNKRIAAALFICFLQRNGCLLRKDGSRRIDENALVALTLMIAASKPSEKDAMVKVVLNLLAPEARGK